MYDLLRIETFKSSQICELVNIFETFYKKDIFVCVSRIHMWKVEYLNF